jgi:hypothetical protein
LVNDLATPNPIRSIRLVLETESGGDLVLFSGATHDEMLIVFGRKIGWFDRGPGAGSARAPSAPTVATRGADMGVDDDEEFASRVSLMRRYNGASDEDVQAWRATHARVKAKPVVLVLGLTFLKHAKLTVDIDDGRLAYEPYAS